MRRSPEQTEITLEGIASCIGRKDFESLRSLPRNFSSSEIASKAYAEKIQVEMGIRPLSAPPSGIYWLRERLVYLNNFIRTNPTPPSQFDLITLIYPRKKEICFDLDTWRTQLVKYDTQMAIHASEYGCNVFFRKGEPHPRAHLPSDQKLIDYNQFADNETNTWYNQVLEKFRNGLPERSRVDEVINKALVDAEAETIIGLPHYLYMPFNLYVQSLRLAVLVATHMGLEFYRSINYKRFTKFTAIELQQLKRDYELHLTEIALMERVRPSRPE